MKKLIFVFYICFITVIFYSCESNDSPVVDNTPPVNTPVLLIPENNSIVTTLEPDFDWTDFPGASGYILQVSDNSSFTVLLLDTSGLTGSSYSSPDGIFDDGNSYYWRVKSTGTSDTTDWSAASSFSTLLDPINPTNKVLVEIFTNTSCIPCVEANTYLDEIYELNGVTNSDENVVILRIHTTLYAGDPFYHYNTTDNNARMAFYPNSAIVNPRTFLLGSYLGAFSSAAWTNKINEKLADTRTYAIKLTNTYDTVSRTGNINVLIKQVSGAALNDLVYHVAVSENDIQYSAPNGETHFDNTLRDLITPPTGQAFVITPGQTKSFNQSYSIDTQINQDKTDIIVFVQRNNSTGKEVMAAEWVKLK